jgi:hypothetical protein
MATTLTESKAIPIGQGQALCFGTLLFDSSYPTSGEIIDATGDLGYSDFWVTGTSSGYHGSWDPVNQKLLMYQQSAATSALTQVPNTTDLSAVTVHYGAIRPA